MFLDTQDRFGLELLMHGCSEMAYALRSIIAEKYAKFHGGKNVAVVAEGNRDMVAAAANLSLALAVAGNLASEFLAKYEAPGDGPGKAA